MFANVLSAVCFTCIVWRGVVGYVLAIGGLGQLLFRFGVAAMVLALLD